MTAPSHHQNVHRGTPFLDAWEWTIAFMFAQAAWFYVGIGVVLESPSGWHLAFPFFLMWAVGLALCTISEAFRQRLLIGSIAVGFASIIPCLPFALGYLVFFELGVWLRGWDHKMAPLILAATIANINMVLILTVGHLVIMLRRKRKEQLRFDDR